MTDMDRKAFRIVEGKGFQLDLPNGVTVSVQFGPSNYADSDARRQDWDAPKRAMAADEPWQSDLAECAAYRTDSGCAWVSVPGYTGTTDDGGWMDDVCGYMDMPAVLGFIFRAAMLDDPRPNRGIGNEMMGNLSDDPVPSDQFPELSGQTHFDFTGGGVVEPDAVEFMSDFMQKHFAKLQEVRDDA